MTPKKVIDIKEFVSLEQLLDVVTKHRGDEIELTEQIEWLRPFIDKDNYIADLLSVIKRVRAKVNDRTTAKAIALGSKGRPKLPAAIQKKRQLEKQKQALKIIEAKENRERLKQKVVGIQDILAQNPSMTIAQACYLFEVSPIVFYQKRTKRT